MNNNENKGSSHIDQDNVQIEIIDESKVDNIDADDNEIIANIHHNNNDDENVDNTTITLSIEDTIEINNNNNNNNINNSKLTSLQTPIKIPPLAQPDDELEIAEKAEEIDKPQLNENKKKKQEAFMANLKLNLKKQFKENMLLFMTIVAVIVGVLLGFILRANFVMKPPAKAYFAFLGEIFLRMLKFLIYPLMSSSLISGIAGLSKAKTGHVASRAFAYYFSTTFMAAVLGLTLVISISPGQRVKIDLPPPNNTNDMFNGQKIQPIDTIMDLIRNLFPDNIVQMAFVQYETKLVPKYVFVEKFHKRNNITTTTTTMELAANNSLYTLTAGGNYNKYYEKELDYWQSLPSERNGLNVLGLVMFCLVFGYIISCMGEKGTILVNFFEAINEASIRMITLVMIYSPIGICSLICSTILSMDNPVDLFERIGYYMITVLAGLIIHGFIILPIMYIVITRKNVLVYAKNMLEALLVAIATSSSSATLPVTFKCIEEKNKIPKMISRFVLPVGATINMDGTALYEAIAAIFIAQINNIDLKFTDYIITSLTATVASIGAAGVPSAGLVTMVMVLSALNLPASQISLIYAVDWFLDRFRTVINVWGDAIGAGIVAHLSIDKDDEDDDDEKDHSINDAYDERNNKNSYINHGLASSAMKINEKTTCGVKSDGETIF